MADEKKEKMKSIIYRKADKTSTDEVLAKDIVFIFNDNESPEMKIFNNEIETNEFINDSLKETPEIRVATYDPVLDEATDKMVMDEYEKQYKHYAEPTETHEGLEDDDEEYKPILTDRGEEILGRHTTLKKVAAWAGVTAVVATAGFGISNLINNAVASDSTIKNNDKQKETDTEIESATLEEIMNQLEEGSLAKTEYQKALNFCEHFNKLASQPGNFRIDSDGENYLEITAEEVLYTSIVLNNYNDAQIREIFGAKQLDSAEVMKGFESVCEKVRIYSMNATEQTGLETLINDSNAQNFFRGTENSVIEFNRSIYEGVNIKFSDKALSTVKNNFAEAKTVNPAVAYLTSMTINGFADANVNNPELLTYNGTLENTTGINNGETASDIIGEIKEQNYLSSAKTSIETNVTAHNAKVATELSESRTKLVDALKSNGDTELANTVSTKTDISDLKDQITSKGGDIADLYNAYNTKANSMNPAGIPADAIIAKIDQEVTSGKTCDLSKLKANRIRETLEKTNSITDADQSYNNSYDSSQNTTDEELDSIEKEDEVIIEDNEEFIDQSLEGIDSAIDYVNTPGAYKYNGVLQNEYMDVPYTDEEKASMTPSQIWKEMAMAGIDIPNIETDEQIQEYINQVQSGKADSFKESLAEQLKAELSISEEQAKETINDYKNMYEQAEKDVNELNKENNTTIEDSEQLTSEDTTTIVEGENLTQEESTATATVVTDEVEVLSLDDTTVPAYSDELNNYDADVNEAANELINANQDYYGYSTSEYTDINVKTK